MARINLQGLRRKKKEAPPQGINRLKARTQGIGRVLALGVVGVLVITSIVVGIYLSAQQGVKDIGTHNAALQDVRLELAGLQEGYTLDDIREPLLGLSAQIAGETFEQGVRLPLLDVRPRLGEEAALAFDALAPVLFAAPISGRLETLLANAETVPEVYRYLSISKMDVEVMTSDQFVDTWVWFLDDLRRTQLPQQGKARAREEVASLFYETLSFGEFASWSVDDDVVEDALRRVKDVPMSQWLYEAVLAATPRNENVPLDLVEAQKREARWSGRDQSSVFAVNSFALRDALENLFFSGSREAPVLMARRSGASLLAPLDPAFRPVGQNHVLKTLETQALQNIAETYQQTLGLEPTPGFSYGGYSQDAALKYDEDLYAFWTGRLADIYLIPPGSPDHALDQLVLLFPQEISSARQQATDRSDALIAFEQNGLFLQFLDALEAELSKMPYQDTTLAGALGFGPDWRDQTLDLMDQLRARAADAAEQNATRAEGQPIQPGAPPLRPKPDLPGFLNTWLLEYDAALIEVMNPRDRAAALNRRWRETALEQCGAIGQKYPFRTIGILNRDDREEASLVEAARMFAPYGVMSSYLASIPTAQRDFLSEAPRPFLETAPQAAAIGLIARPVEDLRIATLLSFGLEYPATGDQVLFEFSAQPIDLNQLTARVSLSLGQREVAATNDGGVVVDFLWPPVSGLRTVGLAFERLDLPGEEDTEVGWEIETNWPLSRLKEFASREADLEGQLLLDYELSPWASAQMQLSFWPETLDALMMLDGFDCPAQIFAEL